ncbi:hypothetical protein LguiA_036450 [Lonicera macranthoides]
MAMTLRAKAETDFICSSLKNSEYRLYVSSKIMDCCAFVKDFSTKILDFALVKKGLEIEETRISIRVIGTYDYAALE